MEGVYLTWWFKRCGWRWWTYKEEKQIDLKTNSHQKNAMPVSNILLMGGIQYAEFALFKLSESDNRPISIY